MKVAAIVIASTAALALTACGGSTPAPTVTVTVAASSSAPAASETPTPEGASESPTPEPEPTLAAGSTAAEVAAFLGCGNVKPKKISSGSNMGLPKPTSEVDCSDDGVKYVVTVYKSESALTKVLLFTNGFLASSLRKPWTYGAGDTWVIGAGGADNLQPLPDSMVARVEAAGGVVKTIKPS